MPSTPALLGVIMITFVVVAVLTNIPAPISARRSVADIRQSELASKRERGRSIVE
jgi:hypothetical protein